MGTLQEQQRKFDEAVVYIENLRTSQGKQICDASNSVNVQDYRYSQVIFSCIQNTSLVGDMIRFCELMLNDP